MLKINHYWPLVLVFIFALFLRVWKLDQYPAGLNADEAAIGYNAYSLLQTGKDEFGHPWPINFQSFNDYKPGLYFYLVLPFVKVLGLNVWAVRLPSAILGAFSVLVLYFLVSELFSKKAAFLASLVLAISPWHLHFSRGGWESNAATFFIILGVYLFFKAPKKPRYFMFSALFLLAAMFTYHSARLVVPLLVVGLVFFNRKEVFLKKNFKGIVSGAGIGAILLFFLLLSMTGEAGASRFSGVGIFADQGPLWRVNELRGQHQNPFGFTTKLVHNKYFEYGLQFLDNWLRHFEGNFLFISGDEIQRNRIPEMGQLYLLEIPLLILGFYFLVKKKPLGWQSILWWLAVAPAASALTFQSPHAIRALNMVIPLAIITGYGLFGAYEELQKKLKKPYLAALCSFFLLAYLWNFSFYLHQYYVHYPKIYPAAWEYGFEELSQYISENQNRFDEIRVTNHYDQPYILLAFYLKYPPQKFQKQARLTPRDQYGFSTVENFDKYYFGPIDWRAESSDKRVMIIGSSNEIPDSATIAKRIYFKDGKTEAFRIIEK